MRFCSTTWLSGARHVYCWMTNHLHLLMQITADPLGKLAQRIAVPHLRGQIQYFGVRGNSRSMRTYVFHVERPDL